MGHEHEHEVPAPRGAGPVRRQELPSQGAGPLNPAVGAMIEAQRGGGSPLPGHVRADLEPHFGADLSAVRLHTGPQAAELNSAVQAEAFTTGTDIFFGSGSGDPTGPQARELLAHELTHVVQQSTGGVGGESRVSAPDEPAEVAAREVARAVASAPAAPAPQAVAPDEVLRLQQMAGNAAVQRLLPPAPGPDGE
ncbi:MAG TPA: DUF4157 domain-containing protein [Micromonosporaceae bacterium]|nr:DUF4157 domain-containing protein [Micromonosporaceae bacterium]